MSFRADSWSLNSRNSVSTKEINDRIAWLLLAPAPNALPTRSNQRRRLLFSCTSFFLPQFFLWPHPFHGVYQKLKRELPLVFLAGKRMYYPTWLTPNCSANDCFSVITLFPSYFAFIKVSQAAPDFFDFLFVSFVSSSEKRKFNFWIFGFFGFFSFFLFFGWFLLVWVFLPLCFSFFFFSFLFDVSSVLDVVVVEVIPCSFFLFSFSFLSSLSLFFFSF